VWHLNEDWDVRTRWIVVRRQDYGAGQLLMTDPYHHDLLPTRGAVGGAIRFALKNGWRPERKAAPLRLSFAGRERGFQLATEPNDPVQPTGASRSGQETKRVSSAAGSGG
jgi:hypothetical protein